MESLIQVLFYDIMKMTSIFPKFKNENIVKRLPIALILGIMKVTYFFLCFFYEEEKK